MTAGLQTAAQWLTLVAADSLVLGAVVFLLALAGSRIARGHNAGARFVIWFATMLGIAIVPAIHGAWAGSGAGGAVSHPAITLPVAWAVWFFLAWAVIAGGLLLRVGRAVGHLCVLRRSGVAVDVAELDPMLRETLRRNRKREFELCTSTRVQVPTAIGLMNPAILIPRWVMEELTADELNQVVLHEMAHLRRWDDWTNLAQEVVRAVLFFHPAVWWIGRKISLEREMACDDAVLAETARPRAYAECLTHLAEKSIVRRSLALAQAALGKIRQTSLRVAEILDHERPTRASSGRVQSAMRLAAVLTVAGAVWITARVPRLIAFENVQPRVSEVAARVSLPGPTSVKGANASSVTLAGLKEPGRSSHAENFAARRVRPATERLAMQPRESDKRIAVASSAGVKSGPDGLHLTRSAFDGAHFEETVFVIIQRGDSGAAAPPVYQIQMWRVMILREVMPPTAQVPRKET